MIQKDVFEVYKYCKTKYQIHSPIGLHGTSLGGYFALQLATHIPVDQLFFIHLDRTFSSIDDVISKKYGKCVQLFFKAI